MVALQVDGLAKGFRTSRGTVDVLASVTFHVERGEWLTCLGPSGCGKTTSLRVLAGLLDPDAGSVWLDGVRGSRLGRTAYLPQEDTLLPWRTALQNAILPAEIDGRPLAAARAEAMGLFDRFGLLGFENLYPSHLSGGMRQRVELARTFLSQRDLLLLDEPLGALDPLTRASLQEWLFAVWSNLRRTVVLVTHDIEEAVLLSDRLLLLTARPATVRETVSLTGLPRPRRRADPAVVAERARLLSVLAPEVSS
jgi:ABC-type nitrate/sulfonate/bicarbonate transport system ATPase subunit